MTPAPDTLKLAVGESHVIALQYADGKPCKSRFSGDQIMFSLVDGRKLFVDPYVDERIKALRVGPGQPFEIEKRESFAGNRRTVEVVVRAARRGAGATSEVAAPGPLRGNGSTSHSQPTAPQPVTWADLDAPAKPSPPPLPVNGAGETAGDVLKRAYCEAVDIALYTVECARQKGILVTPLFEDVRAIAFSISGLGGRR
jgi:hypothetical protein